MADLNSISIMCDRCGLSIRGTVGSDVVIVQAVRKEWSPKCWHRPQVRDPLGCGELLRALQNAMRAADGVR